MSDTSNAPAPAEVANTPSETVIEQAPLKDAEVTNRVPDDGEGKVEAPIKAPTRQEALKAAMERSKAAQAEKAAKEPAKAIEKPPANAEATEKQLSPAQKAQQAARQAREQARQATQQGEQLGPDGKPVLGPDGKPVAAEKPSAYRDPPQRFDEVAKKEWARAPEAVRGAVHRMQQEFQQGFEKVRPDLQAFQEVKEYHELAKSHGTSLKTAVEGYWAMEQRLRGGDVVGGLAQIIENLDLKTSTGHKLNIYDVARFISEMEPGQLQQHLQGNQQQQLRAQTQHQQSEVAELKQTVQQFMHQQRIDAAKQTLEQFKQANPRYDELVEVIADEMERGYPLDEAYRRADKLYPPAGGRPNAAHTRTAAAQTRTVDDPADRSIAGSPDLSGGDNAPERRKGKPPSRREALQNAMRRVGAAS